MITIVSRRPLVATFCALVVAIVIEVMVFTVFFSWLPVGSVAGFALLLLPIGLVTLLALGVISITLKRVLAGSTPWYHLIVAVVLLLTALLVAALSFYFLVFALFGYA